MRAPGGGHGRHRTPHAARPTEEAAPQAVYLAGGLLLKSTSHGVIDSQVEVSSMTLLFAYRNAGCGPAGAGFGQRAGVTGGCWVLPSGCWSRQRAGASRLGWALPAAAADRVRRQTHDIVHAPRQGVPQTSSDLRKEGDGRLVEETRGAGGIARNGGRL